MPKAEAETLDEYCKAKKLTKAGFIRQAIKEKMEREYTKVVDIRQEAVYSCHSITKEQRDFVMEFKNKVWEKVYKEAGWLERFQLKFIYFL